MVYENNCMSEIDYPSTDAPRLDSITLEGQIEVQRGYSNLEMTRYLCLVLLGVQNYSFIHLAYHIAPISFKETC